MSKEYIEKEAFVAEMKKRQEAAKAWLKGAKNQETRVRADAVLCFIQEIKLTLEKIASANVKPVVKGYWISEGDNVFEWCDYKCSVCGQAPDYFVYGTEDWGCDELPNFCPNCGADMRQEANEEGV